jgi:hypothetical protein
MPDITSIIGDYALPDSNNLSASAKQSQHHNSSPLTNLLRRADADPQARQHLDTLFNALQQSAHSLRAANQTHKPRSR